MIAGQVLYPDLDVCHKATNASKSVKERLSGLITAEQIAVCACVCDERTDDAGRLGQLSHLKALARSHSQNETPMSAHWLQAVVSSKGFSHRVCRFKYINTNPNLSGVPGGGGRAQGGRKSEGRERGKIKRNKGVRTG